MFVRVRAKRDMSDGEDLHLGSEDENICVIY